MRLGSFYLRRRLLVLLLLAVLAVAGTAVWLLMRGTSGHLYGTVYRRECLRCKPVPVTDASLTLKRANNPTSETSPVLETTSDASGHYSFALHGSLAAQDAVLAMSVRSADNKARSERSFNLHGLGAEALPLDVELWPPVKDAKK